MGGVFALCIKAKQRKTTGKRLGGWRSINTRLTLSSCLTTYKQDERYRTALYLYMGRKKKLSGPRVSVHPSNIN